ncbi:MAG: glutamate--tRNA ligase [Candidatus Zixiibacteriota bacterium]|nr:MAG: glutamate--tRNA ligase [candidate division Zixibacteria bacterium]
MSDSQMVRVRIAPSPSGYLHVGTARTAIANYLFARHNKGRFLIRIEDTDAARSDPALVQPILDSLNWLGVAWDEDIVYQSARLGVYREYAEAILRRGAGYRCFCSLDLLEKDRREAREQKRPLHYNRRCLKLTPEEIDRKLARGEEYAVRIRIPEGVTTFADMVSGELKRSNDEIEDFVIARSDGSATYNLAVVVDDHDMGITHVIRGNDHITNTFKQLHIYRALDFTAPAFAHIPLLLRPDKRKVSKRLGDKDVGEYRQEGILPEALFNFLSLLGWSPKTNREIYTPHELVEIFTPDNFNVSNAIFDEEKLEAVNREHIAKKTDHELAVMVAPLLVEAGFTTKYWLETRWEYLRSVIRLLRQRVRRITDFVNLGSYFFDFDYSYDPAADEKNFTPEAAELLSDLADRFAGLAAFTAPAAESVLNELAEERGLKRAKLIHPVRLAVSGVPGGPGLFEMMELLTGPVIVERLIKAVEYIKKKPS